MTTIAPVLTGLPTELVELVIEYACSDKFVLVSEKPVSILRFVEDPPCIGIDHGWYWINGWDKDEPGWIGWDWTDYPDGEYPN